MVRWYTSSVALILDRLVEVFPTPAGVMAGLVANKWCRIGLGGEASNGSNP
jgi:hypothetical protein